MLKLFLITFLCVTAYAQPFFIFGPKADWEIILDKIIGEWNPQIMSNRNSIMQQQQQPQQPSHNRPPSSPESMTTTASAIP